MTTNNRFRDTLEIVGEQGKRLWVYAKAPSGRLHNLRIVVAIILLTFFFAAPHITIGGDQFLLMDVIERKYIIFGKIFWAQEGYLFFLMMISMILFLILFTVVYGRIFCGWFCPQTVFVEMVFRKIEYLIEGNHKRQKALDQQGLDIEKFFKKGLKHLVFWVISLAFVITLSSYVVGMDDIKETISGGFILNKSAWIGMFVFATVVYFVWSKLRELVCIVACPYGRLQGVLLDSSSITVSYDYKRGEPRGTKNNREESGDCIDCSSCVQVCPTGIDIRNGTQLECINCTACIDACNSVMKRTKKPEGLIRLTSEKSIREGGKRFFTLRSIAYTAVLVGLLSFTSFMLLSREEIETNIMRTRSMTFQEQPDNRISNMYSYTILNKTRIEKTLSAQLISHKGEVFIAGGDIHLKAGSSVSGVILLYIERDELRSGNNNIEIGIYEKNRLIEKVKTNFIGPIKNED